MGARVLAYRDVLFTDTRQEHQDLTMGARVLAYRDVLFTDIGHEHQGPQWALVSSHTETCCSLTQDKSTRDLTMGARVLAYRDVLFTDTGHEHQGPHDGRSCPRIQRRAVH
ncbi:hypothetical protein NDU88_000437 [Pleurodeles waltl]|uniref:Uncharacterized protein n=1 Tax=Pleurodeles waltl TaxID=8319 RepID=A0AAV7R6T5_PLEWA|nr:hypothetical protein NDU88_000437 [Pleurodeles waltl]